MAENITLEFILDGISYLETKKELKKVLKAEKERLTEFPKRTNVALAEGNSDEMIRVNKEKFDYIGVPQKDLPKAEKWFKAAQPFWTDRTAYNQWRVWNAAKTNEGKDIEGYKGGLIIEKATGKSVPPPETPEWESEDEEEGEEVTEEVTEEMTVAMAAVRVE